MNGFSFLAQWAIRSSILIFGGALLIWVTRLKDPALRLAAWIALLIGSLLIPVMAAILPVLPVRVLNAQLASRAQSTESLQVDLSGSAPAVPEPVKFNWYRAGLMLYAIVAAGMLLRLCVGLALSW